MAWQGLVKLLTGECRGQRESAEELDFRTSLALPIGSRAGWQLGKGCTIRIGKIRNTSLKAIKYIQM